MDAHARAHARARAHPRALPVPCALLQGDGEVSFCGAIEMAGFAVMKTKLLRNGMEQYLTPTVGACTHGQRVDALPA